MRMTISREEIHRAIRQYVRDYYKLEPQWNVGMASSYTPGKECYLCPNGVEECF